MMFHRARKCLCLAHSYSIGSLRSVKSSGVSVLSLKSAVALLHGHQTRTGNGGSWLPREQPLNHAVLHTSATSTRARTKGPRHVHHAVLHTSATSTRARTKGPLHVHHAVLHTSATSTRARTKGPRHVHHAVLHTSATSTRARTEGPLHVHHAVLHTSATSTTARTKGPQMHETQTTDPPHKLLVIQPEYKTGPVEKPYVSAALKLEEGVTLVDAIAGWEVKGQRIEAIRQINSKYLFGTGKIKELKADVRSIKNSITGVFINTPTLTPVQHKHLTAVFKTNVFDRFGIVLRIFKERAVTREAKLQVELAEIPYLRAKLSENRRDSGSGDGGETAVMAIKARLNQRQKRYKMELDEIRSRRKTERDHRARHVGLPIVAVVGYTNAGKTSLIKSLTQDDSMNPENKLFATLDSTMHAGRLPCGLRVLYVDTIGFISDLPHELVESFASTLEDVTSAVSVCECVCVICVRVWTFTS